MIRVRPAAEVSVEALREGMGAGFSDYVMPMSPSAEAFTFMMRQRGLHAGLSQVAIQEGVVQAVWLVSVNGPRGYLIASATRPEMRGRGLARALAGACFDGLRSSGVTRFQTEVMEGNGAAQRLYERLGMLPVRMLDCYTLAKALSVGRGPVPVQGRWEDIAAVVGNCRDWPLSWQNDDAALARVADDLDVLTVWDGAGLAGYAVMIRPTGVLAQVAIRPDARRRGLARALVAAATARCDKTPRVLNADRADDGFAAFMGRIGASRGVGQYELAGPV